MKYRPENSQVYESATCHSTFFLPLKNGVIIWNGPSVNDIPKPVLGRLFINSQERDTQISSKKICIVECYPMLQMTGNALSNVILPGKAIFPLFTLLLHKPVITASVSVLTSSAKDKVDFWNVYSIRRSKEISKDLKN